MRTRVGHGGWWRGRRTNYRRYHLSQVFTANVYAKAVKLYKIILANSKQEHPNARRPIKISGQKTCRGKIKIRRRETGGRNDGDASERIHFRRSTENFRGRERSDFQLSDDFLCTEQVKTRARCRAANRKVFLPFRCRKLRHFMKPLVCGSASIRLRSISSFNRKKQDGIDRGLKKKTRAEWTGDLLKKMSLNYIFITR